MAIIIQTGKCNTEDAIKNGKYPLFDRSNVIKKSNNYIFNGEYIIVPGEGNFTPKYYIGKFNLHQRAYALNSNYDLNKYLYFFILKNWKKFYCFSVGSTVPSLRKSSFSWINNHKFPSLKIQKQIIDIIEPIEKFEKLILDIINKMLNLISKFENNKNIFKLNDISKIIKNKPKKIKQISAKVLSKKKSFIIEIEEKNTYKTNTFFCEKNILLINKIRLYLKKWAILPIDADVNGTLAQIEINKKQTAIINNLMNDNFWNQAIKFSKGTKMPIISIKDLMENIILSDISIEIEKNFEFLSILNRIVLKIKEIKKDVILILIKR